MDGHEAGFSATTRDWFERAFGSPTRVQRLGWPILQQGRHALLAAPTGSGKTLAAFLWAIDRCLNLPREAAPGVRVLYVSPLKALVYDVERNLRAPLLGIRRHGEHRGEELRQVEVDIRTGDTPARDRRAQARRPADILVTTAESLFLMLGSSSAETFASVHTVIIDEIHVFAPSKRGAHLALSLERLEELVTARAVTVSGARGEIQRIGLSATVRPLETVAGFLGGDRTVAVVDAGEAPAIDLRVVVPVPDMDEVEAKTRPSRTARQAALAASTSAAGPGWPRGAEVTGVWPAIYPAILDRILAHRSTIVFVNSRGLCERLAQRLNELYHERTDEGSTQTAGDLVQAHHGSVSHEQRAQIEEALKSGALRALVATSSLELGIDMGAVDLVILVESPGSAARGLQRVGRAGHGVGEISQGVLFPKFKGDLLECAVVSRLMVEGRIEALAVPRNPLDVLAQQVAAMVCDRPRTPAEVARLVRRAFPYRELGEGALRAVLEMLAGSYPSDEFADLRPRLRWDRAADQLEARRGTALLLRFAAGTIPDRGYYAVHLAGGEQGSGPRLGELDEEMVYESRAGDVFLLGASSWRIVDITRDRVLVAPAPGEPGRMPFWKGDGPGRPIELGKAIAATLGELAPLDDEGRGAWLSRLTPLDALARRNLVGYLREQEDSTGVLPSARTLVVERFRDEMGDWRVCLLNPLGARVNAPWAMAIETLLSRRSGFAVESLHSDDGVVLRFAESDELPPLQSLFPEPEELDELVLERVGDSALFASLFREAAGRAMLLPKKGRGGRTPLWLQRLRAKNLLAAARRFPDFPLILETYRECLHDHFDLPALVEFLAAVRDRRIRVVEVETSRASPFARSLAYAYIAQYLYEVDSPLAERRAQALTLDRNLLRELLGQLELRELIDVRALQEVEDALQCLTPDRRARDADELHDLLRRLGDASRSELEQRSFEEGQATGAWLEELRRQRRAVEVRIGGETRWIDVADAPRYRDALGVAIPPGLPTAHLPAAEHPLRGLLERWARSHGPFELEDLAQRFAAPPATLMAALHELEREGVLVRGEIRPGGRHQEWCNEEVLRRIKRQTLARLRGEVAAVDGRTLAAFLVAWHQVNAIVGPAPAMARPGAGGSWGRPRGHRAGTAGKAAAPLALRGGAQETSASLRLQETIDQLAGLALPWSLLITQILPSRIPAFQVEMLDLLAATGELLWVGAGSLGPRDGRVVLLPREIAAAWIENSAAPDAPSLEAGFPDGTLATAVVEHLAARRACFLTEIERSVRERHPQSSSAELEEVLWDLVWAGIVTNDSFLPLRSLGRRVLGGRSSERRGVRGVGAVPRATAWRGRAGTRGTQLAGGRWSLVRDLLDEDLSPTEKAARRAQTLLERYGVVSRDAAVAEGLAGGFASVYPVLSEMEEAGRARRGYFVEGLAGRQFASPGAVERLRAARDEGESVDPTLVVLPALDPANPYGGLLAWPAQRVERGPGPRRVAGAWVVLRGFEPLAFLDAGRRSLVTFIAVEQDGAVADLARALREICRRERVRSLRLQKIDGQGAAGTVIGAPWCAEAGASADGEGLRLGET